MRPWRRRGCASMSMAANARCRSVLHGAGHNWQCCDDPVTGCSAWTHRHAFTLWPLGDISRDAPPCVLARRAPDAGRARRPRRQGGTRPRRPRAPHRPAVLRAAPQGCGIASSAGCRRRCAKQSMSCLPAAIDRDARAARARHEPGDTHASRPGDAAALLRDGYMLTLRMLANNKPAGGIGITFYRPATGGVSRAPSSPRGAWHGAPSAAAAVEAAENRGAERGVRRGTQAVLRGGYGRPS